MQSDSWYVVGIDARYNEFPEVTLLCGPFYDAKQAQQYASLRNTGGVIYQVIEPTVPLDDQLS
jgi:hypothetical protein